jgi:phosphotriesterase-related protein
MKKLVTTLGALTMEQSAIILPHEHVFVDLRTSEQIGYAQAETGDVMNLMVPELVAAKKAGIGVIVDCAPIGVGRRADILKSVSTAADFPLIVPTGVYREPWIPRWVQEAGEERLSEWMQAELTGYIEESDVQAGFIKLSAGDDGLTDCEAKVLRAAVKSAKSVDAVIGSHTIRGRVVRDQLNILEKSGYAPERFIWIHAHVEPDFALHLEMAKRGTWIEYDGIGWGPDEPFIQLILKMLEAGFERQLLLSQDRGWYDPAQPQGGVPKPYTYFVDEFLPKLRAAGVDEDIIRMLTCENPFHAFARRVD